MEKAWGVGLSLASLDIERHETELFVCGFEVES
jgi:hypothetical protein